MNESKAMNKSLNSNEPIYDNISKNTSEPRLYSKSSLANEPMNTNK